LSGVSVDLREEDTQLRYQIEGKRLVCEVPFDRALIETLRDALFEHSEKAWQYPNVAAVVTVGVGVYWYQSGVFWDSFPQLTTPNLKTKWGREFENFLERHATLETFGFLAKEGHHYVAPILAHGGVPHSCLDDLFGLICRQCTHDQTGVEALEYLEGNRRLLGTSKKPVKRFIYHGGEAAEELLSRLLALWRSLERGDADATFGLPKRIVDAFSSWYRDAPESLKSGKRYRFPSPTIRLDPRVMTILLCLPVCTDHPDADECWTVFGRDFPSDLVSEIPIALAPEWQVSCGKRTFRFAGVDERSNPLFFDPSTGKLIRDPERRRLPEQVWALLRDGVESDPDPTHREPFLPWEDYSIVAFDLGGVKRLRVGESVFEVRRPFFQLDDQPVVRNAHSAKTGAPVFNAAPRINWEGSANLTMVRDGANQGNINVSANDLVHLVDLPGEYEIELRGPLGQNHHFEFLLAPGLKVDANPALKYPNSGATTWAVSAPGARITWQGEDGPTFVSHLPSIDFQIVYDDYPLSIRALVPCLEWCITRDPQFGSTEWSTKPQVVEAKSLLSRVTVPVLACRLPLDPLTHRVSIEGKRSRTKLHPKHLSVSGEIFWHFNLREVRDLLLASGKAEKFDLKILDSQGSRTLYRGHALEIRPEWDIIDFQAEWGQTEPDYVVTVSWSETGAEVNGRWLIMRSVWRAWESPAFLSEIPQEERRTLTWASPSDHFPPGRYVLYAVHAPWGLANVDTIEPQATTHVDIHPEIWPEIYDCNESVLTVDRYVERILAHCYRPERVKAPTTVPTGVSDSKVIQFLRFVEGADGLDAVDRDTLSKIALRFFCANPKATAIAASRLEDHRDVLGWALPPLEFVKVSLGEADFDFLVDLVFNFGELRSTKVAGNVAKGHRPRSLAEPLQHWRKDLQPKKKGVHKIPSLGHILFLCERFAVFEERSTEICMEISWGRRNHDK
jgi:hypothetical protein